MPETAVVKPQQPNKPALSVAPIVQLRQRIEARRSEVEAALPPDIPYDSFLRAVMTAAQINPEILGCSFNSIWTSCMQACRDGLLPDGKEAALVPYNGRCSYQSMYVGMVRSFQRSGQFRWIGSGIVYKGEEFARWIDETGEHFRHVPGDNFGGPIVRVYAAAVTKDGAFFCTVLPFAEAEKIRKVSRNSREDSPWRQWPEQMYKKTALKRMLNLIPNVRSVVHDIDAVEVPNTLELTADQLPALPPSETLEEARTGAGGLGASDAGPDPSGEVDAKDEGDNTTAVSPAPAAAPNATPAADPVTIARARGAEERRMGHTRKAVPAEYREPLRADEYNAWVAGWDESGTLLVVLATAICLWAGQAHADHRHHHVLLPPPHAPQTAPADIPGIYRLAVTPPWLPEPPPPPPPPPSSTPAPTSAPLLTPTPTPTPPPTPTSSPTPPPSPSPLSTPAPTPTPTPTSTPAPPPPPPPPPSPTPSSPPTPTSTSPPSPPPTPAPTSSPTPPPPPTLPRAAAAGLAGTDAALVLALVLGWRRFRARRDAQWSRPAIYDLTDRRYR